MNRRQQSKAQPAAAKNSDQARPKRGFGRSLLVAALEGAIDGVTGHRPPTREPLHHALSNQRTTHEDGTLTDGLNQIPDGYPTDP